MNIFRRTIPFTFSLIVLGGFGLMVGQPKLLPFIAAALLVLAFIAVFGIVGQGWKDGSFISSTILLPLFLLTSTAFYLFLERPLFQYSFGVLVAAAVWIYTENLFTFIVSPQRYQPYALENLTTNLALATVFFSAVTFFDLDVFFGISLFILIPVLTIVTILAASVAFWTARYLPAGWPYILVIGLTVLEIAVAISFLPLTPLIKGALIAVTYYLSVEVGRTVMRKESLRAEMPRPLLLAFFIVLALLITTRWR